MRLIDADLLIEEYKTSAENTFNRPIKFKNSLIYKQIKKAPTVTILEDIKAEIEDLCNEPAMYIPNYDAYKKCWEIIDKHIESEE